MSSTFASKSTTEQELITQQYVQHKNEYLATLSQLQSLKAQKEKELASYKSEFEPAPA